MNTAVKFGPASISGYLAALAGIIAGVIEALDSGAIDTTSWRSLLLGLIALVVTNLGRQHQAKAVIEKGGDA